MQDHAVWVWERYVKDAGFDKISIVAHSAGGGCLTAIQEEFKDSFYGMVDKIAYTDSWAISKDRLNKEQQEFMFRNAVHYIASDEPVGTPYKSNYDDVFPHVSAGHPKHEYTTGHAFEEILA